MFHGFLRLYAPYFNAYTFVLARANEFDADRCSAKIVGEKYAASALISLNVKGAHLNDEFWPNMFKRASEQIEAPDVYEQMLKFLDEPVQKSEADFYCRVALHRNTNPLDTHPSLSERLKALNEEAEYDDGTAERSSQSYLSNVAEFIEFFDKQWRADIGPEWKKRYLHYQNLQDTLSTLEKAKSTRQLTVDESLQLANMIEDLKSSEEALPYFQDLVMHEPSLATAHFAIGRIMAKKGRREAVEHLEYCMKLDTASVPHACRVLFLYYMHIGNKAYASEYLDKAVAASELQAHQNRESSTLISKDVLVGEEPSEEVLGLIRDEMNNHPTIERAHILRKTTTYTVDKHIYLVIVEFSNQHTQQKQQILQRIADASPNIDEYQIMEINTVTWLRSSIKKLKVSPIYERTAILKKKGTQISV
ncbi:M48 family metalloprotease [Paenibacillus sp. N3.4]|nr:M48 family metalloprotease [Paenibacillus sp. N3.4]